MSIKNKIKKACNKNLKQEICGFVVFKDGDFDILECENKSDIPDKEFYIPSKDFLYAKKNYDLVAVYHSHINSEEKPSDFDEKMSDLVCLPFVIYSHKTQKFDHHKPEFLDCDLNKFQKLIENL
tara:strand:+ start:4555 stop:4926 length:372 start_codon:yes stop_codon:yes gene_type:complete